MGAMFKRRKIAVIENASRGRVVANYPIGLGDDNVQDTVSRYGVTQIHTLRQVILAPENQKGAQLRVARGDLRTEAFNNSNSNLMVFGVYVLEVNLYTFKLLSIITSTIRHPIKTMVI